MGSLLRLCVGLLTGVKSWMSSFLCRIVGSVPSFFFFRGGEPKEDGARREKSETKLSRENSRKKEDGLRPKKDFKRPLFFSLWGKKRVFETFFSTKKGEKDFLPFFHSPSSESVNKREGRKGKKKWGKGQIN